MENERNSLDSQNNRRADAKSRDQSSNIENEANSSSGTGFSNVGIKSWINNPIIAAALIGAIATIVSTWIASQSSPPDPTPTSTPIATSSPVLTDTPIPLTQTLSPTVSPSSTSTIAITATAVETITLTPAPALIVLLENDRAAGRPPLTVNFDARDSYLIASDGQQYPCKYGACNYTWKVVFEGQKLEKSQLNSSGKFQYTFGKRGKYLISVWICRGKDAVNCGGNGIFIEVG